MAAGTMLLAFCPGGVSSNVISQPARGDLALAVSLTTYPITRPAIILFRPIGTLGLSPIAQTAK
ncbi:MULTISPECIES: hypothetical protein [unclassified Ruegeria]|uniref:hypothetical protein n=1 Tax=Ruegeria sp. R8_1 TaxID=2821109 RepID=UPI0024694F70|nr:MULTISPECIES: hypothetical protein [unclassified Ruegeria]